jgi:threonine/homoserine/homoserine lactone efflux protein
MLYAFALTALLIELTPGPNMTWLAVLGASRGRSVALAAVAGIALGLAIAGLVAGFGLTAILTEVPTLFTALRWTGTLYLLYLAWDAWRDSNQVNTQDHQSGTQAFGQGLISNILNPKAYLFYAAMLPHFVDQSRPVSSQIFFLSAIYVAIATAIHAGIAILAGTAANWLQHSPQAILVRRILALAIVCAAAWFFYSTRMTA